LSRVSMSGLVSDSLTVIVSAAVIVSFAFVVWAIPVLGNNEKTARSTSKSAAEKAHAEEESEGEYAEAYDPDASEALPTELVDDLRLFRGDFLGPFDALGFSSSSFMTATEDDIRTAYRQKARDEHPDRSSYPDAEERFQKVLTAYAILKDEPSREALREALKLNIGSLKELNEQQVEEEQTSSNRLVVWVVALWLAFMAGAILFLQNVRSQDLVPQKKAKFSMVVRLADDGTYDVEEVDPNSRVYSPLPPSAAE